MDLNTVRQDIDRVDTAIKPLFLERMECGKHVAQAKFISGGDVYAPDREKQIIARRTADVPDDVKEEYESFLLHLMSLCRRYEYGILINIQQQTLDALIDASRIYPGKEHTEVHVSFTFQSASSKMNLVFDMIHLNHIIIRDMKLETIESTQYITCTLVGTIQDEKMRLLLCQLAKETENFRIEALI